MVRTCHESGPDHFEPFRVVQSQVQPIGPTFFEFSDLLWICQVVGIAGHSEDEGVQEGVLIL